MNFKFHHMNICTDNLSRLTKFYTTLFELGTISDKEHTVSAVCARIAPTPANQVFLHDPDGHVIEVHQPGVFDR